MNKIFRVIWSKVKNQWQVVSELTSTRVKSSRSNTSTICVVILLFTTNSVLAIETTTLPTGGTVTSGTASISSSGNQMTINQTSQNMVATWDSFNIGSGAGVTFYQPNSAATALNQITDQNPTQILGNLSSNGQIFLINPSGIIFGSSAQVNVGGLIASSLNITDEDFLNGNYQFSANELAGSISNAGIINAAEGSYIAFISPVIDNSGTVTVNRGTVAMAAGDKVNLDFSGDGLISFTVDQGAVDAQIQNSGLIQANGGTVFLTAKAVDELTNAVINTTGIIEAQGLSEDNGRIVLTADGGQTAVAGTLDVSSTISQGGEIIITGERIEVTSGAYLDASGTSGGGTIMVGGGWQGQDSSITNATYINADNTVTVNASASDNGDGGTVVFWSDYENMFEGTILANGGVNGGNGGQVEVSGKERLGYSGLTDTRAANGEMGTLLLDPTTINIKNGSGVNTANTFYEENLEAQLTNIDLQTDASSSGNITLEDLTDNLLLLQTDVSLNIRAGVYASGGRGSYNTVDTNDEIRTSGSGDITIQASGFGGLNAGKLTATGSGKIRLFGDNGLIVGNTVTTNGGIIELWADSDDLGGGSFTLSNAINSNGGDIYLDSGTGGITINGDITTGAGRVYFDTFGTVRNFNVNLNAKIASTGDVTINSPLRFGTGAEIETTGQLTFGSTSYMQNALSTLTLTASSFDIQQDITGNGASITIKPYSASTNVDIGAAGSGDMTFSSTNFTHLTGFSNITVGRSDGTGTTTVVGDTSVATSGYFELANQTVNITGGSLTNTSGDIVLTGDTFNISQSISADSGTGKVTMQQLTAANAITLGSVIGNAELSQISAGTLEIGRTDGGDVNFDGNITTTTDTLSILSGGNITLGNGVTLDIGTGTGVLAAGGNFINNSGSGAITTSGDGRWLIYSTDPATNTFGGLISGNSALWNKTYASYPAESVTQTGNRYLFSIQPTATVTALNMDKTYGETIDLSNPVLGTHYTVSGIIDSSVYGNVFTQDTASDILTGTPVMTSEGASSGANTDGSPYTLTIAQGSLSSGTGYNLTGFTNASITVGEAASEATSEEIIDTPLHTALEPNGDAHYSPVSHTSLNPEISNTDISGLTEPTLNTGGTLTLVSDSEIATVNFQRSNGTLTLSTETSGNGSLVEQVDYLPVFTSEANGTISLEGGYRVNANSSSIALTSVSTGADISLSTETNTELNRSVSFSLGMTDVATLELTATITESGVLIISGANSSIQLDTEQIVLMGLKTVKQELGITLKGIKAILLTPGQGGTSTNI
ncbi:hypothetical protein CSW98_00120 [Vibrio sp. HA2012]|uniref:two-partner secretion domain-containing protein n=1 Tax=Vibrio sp. HA2012 TaxID=1971595 RepID=UPI000C2C34F2|nr:filamentous hemagglutinin N-terminal domain-containing protein [Vibrio sp. HA2012]PJC87573.1 hypothetical protein CSW98_00120 [Vibrio sp. HA2012]